MTRWKNLQHLHWLTNIKMLPIQHNDGKVRYFPSTQRPRFCLFDYKIICATNEGNRNEISFSSNDISSDGFAFFSPSDTNSSNRLDRNIFLLSLKTNCSFSIFLSFCRLEIIWQMVHEFQPPPWATEDAEDDI